MRAWMHVRTNTHTHTHTHTHTQHTTREIGEKVAVYVYVNFQRKLITNVHVYINLQKQKKIKCDRRTVAENDGGRKSSVCLFNRFFFECTKVIGERWRKMTAADRAEYEPTPQQIQVCFIQKKNLKKKQKLINQKSKQKLL